MHPRARLRRLALLAALVASACGSREERLSVLLVTLDTTRADALGCYGAKPDVTPNLDALAAEGVIYLWARTVTPATLPAHASMLTGLYPNRHTVRDNSLSSVPRGATTVAERASRAGFATAAFVSAKVLDRAFGLDQGFESYSQPPRQKEVLHNTSFSSRPAQETADLAAAWLRDLPRERDFFCWVHFFDPHQPWTADARFVRAASGNPYLAEIAAVDDGVGRLVQALRDCGRLERTVIVVVGDHGESLGEHGEESHAYFVFDSTLRVPLIVRRPDRARAGERSEEIVSVVDVEPTLCDALGLERDASADGLSLWNGRAPPERGVYFESFYAYLHYGMAPIAGWVDAKGKYVHSSESELYDPLAHPKERKSLLPERAGDVAAYRARIAEVTARPALEAGASVAEEHELLSDIRSLGYADASGSVGPLPDPLAPCDRPAPHARAEELRACEEGQKLFQTERIAEAEKVLAGIVAQNPRNTFALEFLGFAQLRLQRNEEARATFERALAQGPERASILKALGFALEKLGDPLGAVQRWMRSAELDPSDVETLQYLLRAALERGDTSAEQHWREAIKLAQRP